MKILLEHMGPIDYAEIDLSQWTFLMGAQATGKSTISKAVSFFLSLKRDVQHLVLGQILEGHRFDTKKIHKKILSAFYDLFGTNQHRPDLKMTFIYKNNQTMALTNSKKGIHFECSALIDELQQLHSSGRKNLDVSIEFDVRPLEQLVKRRLDDHFGYDWDVLFIPAGRGLASLLSEELSALNTSGLDRIMREYLTKVNRSRRWFGSPLSSIYTALGLNSKNELYQQAADLIKKILKADFLSSVQDRLYLEDGTYTTLKFASAGQQESIWLMLLLFRYLVEGVPVFAIFEEPEAHLYPEAQQHIVRLITLLMNEPKNSGILTTHSPYIIATLNNHLYAHRIGQNNPEGVEAVLPKVFWRDPEMTKAYFVENGRLTDLMDPELVQIKMPLLDQASEHINNEYDALFDLEAP